MIHQAKFQIGEIVNHLKFNYRGVIYEADAVFSLTDEWYEQVAKSRPPKDEPWYHVLVDKADHSTYVAEQHLIAATDNGEIVHPALEELFEYYTKGRYYSRQVQM